MQTESKTLSKHLVFEIDLPFNFATENKKRKQQMGSSIRRQLTSFRYISRGEFRTPSIIKET